MAILALVVEEVLLEHVEDLRQSDGAVSRIGPAVAFFADELGHGGVELLVEALGAEGFPGEPRTAA